MSTTDGALFFQNFRKADGTPYSGVRLFHYVAGGTTTNKDVFSDAPMTSTAAQPFVGDTNGWIKVYGDGEYRFLVKSSVADGDLTLFDLDPIKLTAKSATLRGENQAASYPAATAGNRGQFFAKTTAGNVVEVGINKDGSGFSAFQLQSDPYTTTVQWAKGADLASAATLTLGTDGNSFDVTGTTQISAISTKTAGTWIRLRFISSGCTVVNNATSLRLRNGQNYSSSAGDVLDFYSIGSGNWQEAMGRQNAVDDVLPFQNATITATVSANALTIALKTKAGSDPTTSDPVRIGYLNNPVTGGGYDVVETTAPLSFVLSAGSTLGFTANQVSRIYVGALNNGGSSELFVYHPLSALSIKGVSETVLQTTFAEGGAGAADSAQILYSTSARSNVSVRLLARIDIATGGTPGNWTSNPSAIRMLGFGVHRTGQIIQEVDVEYSTLQSLGNNTTPADNTIPQISEGNAISQLDLTVTPSAQVNLLEMQYQPCMDFAGATQITFHLHQDATANALKAWNQLASAAQTTIYFLRHRMVAGTTSTTTFKLRFGGNAASTGILNGDTSGAAVYNGVSGSWSTIREICL